MQRRVSRDELRRTRELWLQQEKQDTWWVCDEYELRGDNIISKYSLPWLFTPDSPLATGEEELHWRSYKPLEEIPDLFLKLAYLYEESDFEEAVLDFSCRYGVLGGTSSSTDWPYKTRICDFREEAKQAWSILKLYETVLNRDWKVAEYLLFEYFHYEDFEESIDGRLDHIYAARPYTWLNDAIGVAVKSVDATVQKLCRQTLQVTVGLYSDDPYPSRIESRWQFDNLLGAAYLQMYWLMASGSDLARCEYCNRIISLARPQPEGRKPPSHKRFCNDACRQANHRSKKRSSGAEV